MGLLRGTRRALLGLGGQIYIEKVLSYGPIAYWPLNETSGVTAACQVNAAQNGTYTGVTLGQAGIGDGQTCPLFDGANDYADIQSATLASVFNGGEGSIVIWVKVSGAGVWTDGTTRFIMRIQPDPDNRVQMFRNAANNTLAWLYRSGGTITQVKNAGYSAVNWFHLALTWAAVADEVKAYYNGTQAGATVNGLGVWAGVPSLSVIGAATIPPINVWDGYLAHAAVWNRALTPAEIADLAVV